jgi:tetratricopeptide (TPR) repeat protein
MWLMYGYLQQGRRTDARRLLTACRATATGANGTRLRAPEEDPLDPDNIPAGSYVQMWSRYLLDTEDWESDIARDEIPLGDLTGAKLTRAFVLAVRAAATGADSAIVRQRLSDVADARKALDAVLDARHDSVDQYRRRAAVLEAQARALALKAERRVDEAIPLLREAAASEDAMPAAFGPPFVDKPSHELLGDVLFSAGQPAEAAAAYRAALLHAPNRTGSLLGVARAAARAGDKSASSDAYAQLSEIWQRAERVPDDVRAAAAGRPQSRERF